MAKIKKVVLRCPVGPNGYLSGMINFDVRARLFTFDLPEWAWGPGIRRLDAADIRVLENKIEGWVKDISESLASREVVILYRLERGAAFDHECACRIGVAAGIYLETTIKKLTGGSAVSYGPLCPKERAKWVLPREMSKGIDTHHGSPQSTPDPHRIPCTPEAVAMFCRIWNGMTALREMLQGITETPEAVLKAAADFAFPVLQEGSQSK